MPTLREEAESRMVELGTKLASIKNDLERLQGMESYLKSIHSKVISLNEYVIITKEILKRRNEITLCETAIGRQEKALANLCKDTRWKWTAPQSHQECKILQFPTFVSALIQTKISSSLEGSDTVSDA